MANEKRLIDLDELVAHFRATKIDEVFPNWKELFPSTQAAIIRLTTKYRAIVLNAPIVDVVPVEQYKALLDMYHDLRENFIDYVCSGTCNAAPYCLNRCEECVDRAGWCSQGSDACHGFNPAEVILDGAKMDGDGNA